MMTKVTVIVSTRNRPDQVVECLRTILANPGQDFEVVVVDQSAADARARAQAAVAADPRLRWIGSDTRGLSVSRNVGVAAARGPVIAFTDDDCRVSTDWVARIGASFEAEADLGLLFGAVVLRPEDRARGYAAEFEPKQARTFHHALPEAGWPWGVGANMALRRTVVDEVGAFDPMLGAGAPFHAGEEIDFTIRALAAGFKVRHSPENAVIHLGLREGSEAGRLLRGYGMGLGATLAKHVRLGTKGAAGLMAGWLALQGRSSLGRALKGDRHPGFGLLGAVLLGAGRSLRRPLDRSTRVYG